MAAAGPPKSTSFSRPLTLPAFHTVPYNAIPSKRVTNPANIKPPAPTDNGNDAPLDAVDLCARLDRYIASQMRIADRKRAAAAAIRPVLPPIRTSGLEEVVRTVDFATGVIQRVSSHPDTAAAAAILASPQSSVPSVETKPFEKMIVEKKVAETTTVTPPAPVQKATTATVGKVKKGHKPEQLKLIKRLDVHAKEIARQEARREKKRQHIAAVHAARSKPVPADELARKLSVAAGQQDKPIEKLKSADGLNWKSDEKEETLTTLPSTVYKPAKVVKSGRKGSADSTKRKARPTPLINTGSKRGATPSMLTTTPMTPAFHFSNSPMTSGFNFSSMKSTPLTPGFNSASLKSTPLTPGFNMSGARDTPLTPGFTFPPSQKSTPMTPAFNKDNTDLKTPLTPSFNVGSRMTPLSPNFTFPSLVTPGMDTEALSKEPEDEYEQPREQDEKKHDSGSTAFRWRDVEQADAPGRNDSINRLRRAESVDSTHVQDAIVMKKVGREAGRKDKTSNTSSQFLRRNASHDSRLRARRGEKRSSRPDWELWRWPGGSRPRSDANSSNSDSERTEAAAQRQDWSQTDEEGAKGHQVGMMGLYVHLPSLRRSSKLAHPQPVLPTPPMTSGSAQQQAATFVSAVAASLPKTKKNYAVDSLSTMMTDSTRQGSMRQGSEDIVALASRDAEEGELGLAVEFEFSADGMGIAVNESPVTALPTRWPNPFAATLPPLPASPFLPPPSPFLPPQAGDGLAVPAVAQPLPEFDHPAIAVDMDIPSEAELSTEPGPTILERSSISLPATTTTLAPIIITPTTLTPTLLTPSAIIPLTPTALTPTTMHSTPSPSPLLTPPLTPSDPSPHPARPFALHEKKDSIKERRQRARASHPGASNAGTSCIGAIEVVRPEMLGMPRVQRGELLLGVSTAVAGGGRIGGGGAGSLGTGYEGEIDALPAPAPSPGMGLVWDGGEVKSPRGLSVLWKGWKKGGDGLR